MSEIPLRSFGIYRKSRVGYSALTDSDTPNDTNADHQHESTSSNTPANTNTMPMNARAAIVATAASSQRKGKNRERYVDDPEEQANLLSEEQNEDDYHEDEPEPTSRPGTSVRSLYAF